jgi:hypothetical protein
MGFINHSRMVISRTVRETGRRLLEWIRGEALLVIATGVATFLLTPGDRWDRLLTAVVIPLAGLAAWMILLLFWNLCVAPSRLHDAQEKTIADLQAQISKLRPGVRELAEEDPKVYLDPQNADFVPLGYMAFKISNKGQRVNPAQSVQIRPIDGIPSVAFEYIDRIDPAVELTISPNVGDDFIVQDHDILPELRKAWSDSHARREIDSEEFSFKITIDYRDAKGIRFISEVTMAYSPIAEDAARRNASAYQRGTYPIIKVMNTEFKRLS